MLLGLEAHELTRLRLLHAFGADARPTQYITPAATFDGIVRRDGPNAGRVATRQQLLDNVWGYEYYGDTRTLDVHIRRLRQKLGDCGECIETVIGVGYRFAGCPGPARK